MNLELKMDDLENKKMDDLENKKMLYISLLVRPDFRCTETVQYYQTVSMLREATPLIRPLFNCRRDDLIREKEELLFLKENLFK